MSPAEKAIATACGRFRASSLSRMCRTCARTVFGVTLGDENYYVVEGTLSFRLGERTRDAPAGTFVHIPKGVVHSHWNATVAPVRLLGFPVPVGFEHFFADQPD